MPLHFTILYTLITNNGLLLTLTEHSTPGFEDHSAIRKLSERLDLKHTCGYVTLLRTGKPSQNRYTKPRLKYPFSAGDTSKSHINKALPDLTEKQKAVAGTESTQSPKNGIKDTASAEVLASELDSLEEAMEAGGRGEPRKVGGVMSPSREKMTLELTAPTSGAPNEQSVENDWVMLDCCFGIPLFHADVNRQVCERVASQGLCSKDR